jgi:uncharacterized phage-associated protein
MPQYPVLTIADEILRIAKGKHKSLTPLQLMKLVYIAHGWSLGLGRGDMFPNRIEAWKYGPVIPDLYNATKSYGREPIPLERVNDGPAAVDQNTRDLLDWVYAGYGHLDGIQLSSLTHQPGTPWAQVYRDGVMHSEITDQQIQEHYQRLAHERYSITAPSS